METKFFPILCVSGNMEIKVYESSNKNAVWDACYRMMEMMAPRILQFKIYRAELGMLRTSPVDDEQIEMIDCIMQLLKDLDMRHVKKYNYNDLMKYDKPALQLVMDTLTDQYSAMMN